MSNRTIGLTETILRDASQSLIATRLSFDKMEPILSELDKAGYYSIECWGGATFDVCLRFLDEDPWERLRKFKAAMPNTKLQMLFRGQNILGYKHYPDDIVRRFVRASVRNGIDIIRFFDALNASENLKVAVETAVEEGAMASGAISYTTSPVHTLEAYVKLAKELQTMGVTGMAYLTYLKAVEAGADVIDTAISPFSGGTSQPATETMCVALKELGYNVDVDEKLLYKIADYFKPIRAEYIEDGTLNPISLATDAQGLDHQIPGGMLSNLLSQLTMLGAIDKYEEALKETPRVRADLGYPPLVTPTSQLVGTQAVQNVLAGERYKNVGQEIRAYCRGEYGRTPAPIDPEIRAKILGTDVPVEGRFAATLPTDTFEKAEAELGDMAKSEEDVLSYIAFPPVAEAFFKARKEREEQKVAYSITKVEE